MHILIATPAYPPYVGGGERHTGNLAEHLVACGQRVTVLTSAALDEPDLWLGCGHEIEIEAAEPGLTIIRTPIRPMPGGYRGLLAWRKSMVMLSGLPGTLTTLQTMAERVPGLTMLDEAFATIDQAVDVVHGFNISWEYSLMAGLRFARQNRRPFIATPFAHLGSGPRDRVALNSTMRHQLQLLTTADLVLATTSVEARALQARGINGSSIKVASTGIASPEAAMTLPKIDGSLAPYVLFVGRTSYDKGAMHAVQAVTRLREQGSAVQLVMIGRVTDEFRRFHNGLSVSDKQGVHILGIVEENLKQTYLQNAEALLLPSRSDSFGIVLLESWLHSRPVIAADAGGIPGVVDDGENGFLVPFADTPALSEAIRKVTEDQKLNQVLGENGRRKLVAQYTWETITENVLSAYREVVDTFRPELQNS